VEYPSFVGAGYESQSVTADQERLVNLYVERMESPGATSRSALFPTPGVEAISLTLPPVATPGAPTVAPQGAAGAVTYGYKIVAYLGDGTSHTAAGPEGTTTTGNATLDVTNFNRLTWAAVANAQTYHIYRTTGGPAPPKLLTTTIALTYDDVGTLGTAETPATTNTTGVAFQPTGPGRAHFVENGREYAVEGTLFCEFSQFGVIYPRGYVAIGANPATISSNGDGGGQLFITSGDNGYIYDTATHVVTQVAALNGKATQGGYIDGYFLALDANTSTFYVSDLLDGLTWDPTQFAQRSRAADPWVAMAVNGLYIWLLGEQTSEPWYNAGATFPFAPYPSVLVPYGIAAPFTAVVSDGVLRWLGCSRTGQRYALQATGFSAEVISDFPRQWIWSQYATVSDAQAIAFNYLGHTFYQISFPSQDVTWTWDAQSTVWSQWGTWIPASFEYVVWRPRWHAIAFDEHRILDAATGSLYRMAADLTNDVDGRPIVRERRAPGLTAELERIYYAAFELDLEPGLGTSTGQGADPQVMLMISDDGGKTWGNEMWRSAGKIGEYGWRVRWLRLGQARRRVFRVMFSDPVPLRVTNAYLTLGQRPQAMNQQQRQSA
jgi:hypothetical protein